jgi:hypothetical protein
MPINTFIVPADRFDSLDCATVCAMTGLAIRMTARTTLPPLSGRATAAEHPHGEQDDRNKQYDMDGDTDGVGPSHSEQPRDQ